MIFSFFIIWEKKIYFERIYEDREIKTINESLNSYSQIFSNCAHTEFEHDQLNYPKHVPMNNLYPGSMTH